MFIWCVNPKKYLHGVVNIDKQSEIKKHWCANEKERGEMRHVSATSWGKIEVAVVFFGKSWSSHTLSLATVRISGMAHNGVKSFLY